MDKIKPMKPVKTSVKIKPKRDTTKISASGTKNKLENKITAVNSLVPKPAKVIGINPTAFAIGNNNIKYK